MTAVPKPLKFLRPHYENLEKAYESWPAGENKVCEDSAAEHATQGLTGIAIACRHDVRLGHDILG